MNSEALTVDEAVARVLAAAPRLASEEVALVDADGRVLAEDIVAPRCLPPWDASAMDGFAVRAADVPGRLRVVDTVVAGRPGRRAVGAGEAARILTGAPVPEGADAVVMVEDTRVSRSEDGEWVATDATIDVGRHIRSRGSEVALGDAVLSAGARVGPAAVLALASLGVDRVRVARRPRVVILATGDELVEPGGALGPAQIHASNGLALAALVREVGGEPRYAGVVPDDPARIRAAVQSALTTADVLITTGGVSVGETDHVRGVLEDLGIALDFWRVAMKPGKPFAFATTPDGVPVFGLPGNPVSCVVGFQVFVAPLLRRALGCPAVHAPMLDAVLVGGRARAQGRLELVRVALARGADGVVLATAPAHQGSAAVLSLAHAHGLAIVPASAPRLEGPVRVLVFDPSWDAAPDRRYQPA